MASSIMISSRATSLCLLPTQRASSSSTSAYHTTTLAAQTLRWSPRTLQKDRYFSGTFYWCSVSTHNGLAPHPQDDLESLFFVLLFL
ncbi:hypothetical protein C8T65DRAFT_22113 [Cerioporus squamosus]|nr:hypothetical protein C8T65DRAFT_22113 [Cerioporus squamosus]